MSGRVLYTASNYWGDTMKVYENYVSIDTVELSAGWFDWIGHDPLTEQEKMGRGKYLAHYVRKEYKPGVEKIYSKDIRTITFHEGKPGPPRAVGGPGCIKIESERSRDSKFIYFMGDTDKVWWKIAQHLGRIAGLNAKKNHDESRAIMIYEKFSLHGEAKRLRKKMRDEGKVKVDQTVVHGDVVHGDYVDDRDTIIKDSVINRSNVGVGGDDKFTKLKELTEMKEKGLIDDAEFKQMKKEILGFSSKSISEEGNWWEE